MAGSGARCPAPECGEEGSVRQVESHLRSCRAYAALPADAVLDPAEAYRIAHAAPKEPVVKRTAPVRRTRSAASAPDVSRGAVSVEIWERPDHAIESDAC